MVAGSEGPPPVYFCRIKIRFYVMICDLNRGHDCKKDVTTINMVKTTIITTVIQEIIL